MPKLNWNGDDFRSPEDSAGTVADNISRGGSLQQGYFHGSLTEGLVAYYPMDSGSGSTVTDEVMSNDGTTDGDWVSGKYGTALAFDSSDDALELGEVIGIPSMENATLSFWAAHTDKGPDGHATMYSESASGSDQATYFAVQYEPSDPKLDLHSSVADIYQKSSFTIPFDGSWHHYVVRKQGNSFKVFVDGVKEGEWILDFTAGAEKTYIGERTPPTNYQPIIGSMDELRIYDRPLSTPEIKALYQLEKPSEISPDDTL
ncbi:LamG-like jellyroll fold domain-containing protein [Candidatus Nanosalina sp. VS9-1]|uniref:LamG-like jellyroll fold domain-containing protein n=1 Tax=Candidatus Nanosalina sp. VS9-1 TaxID=3388566 RepID=UPI0039E1F5E0